PCSQRDCAAGGEIPNVQASLPEGVVGAVGYEATIDGGRTAAPDPLHASLHALERVEVVVGGDIAVRWKSGCEKSARQVVDGAHRAARAISESADVERARPRKRERRRDHDPENGLGVTKKADAHAEERVTVDEVHRAVERVDV